jgi:uncharacterized Fe-S cluster protein YjdI/uncharacterized damage-inducible protein DinB
MRLPARAMHRPALWVAFTLSRAYHPRMPSSRALQTYRGEAVTVTFDSGLCIHSEKCVRALPAVFDPTRTRWIRPDAAGADEVVAAVARCPPGALRTQRAGEPTPVLSAPEVVVTVSSEHRDRRCGRALSLRQHRQSSILRRIPHSDRLHQALSLTWSGLSTSSTPMFSSFFSEQVRLAQVGPTWHGAALGENLEGIDAAQAASRPVPEAHSIWEIVLHMTGWTREVARRLQGGHPAPPAEGDWPAVGRVSEEAWSRARAALSEAHSTLADAVERFPEARWSERVGGERDPPLGTGVSYAAMLAGLVQHDAYHGGQIGLLRKALRL